MATDTYGRQGGSGYGDPQPINAQQLLANHFRAPHEVSGADAAPTVCNPGFKGFQTQDKRFCGHRPTSQPTI